MDATTSSAGSADVAIVGAGAAGLMAGIAATRANPAARVLLVDGAERLGAKILISGGGRCNVTHHEVHVHAFAGSSRNAIKKVLRRFGVSDVVAFFASRGVELRREETGKLFPTTNRARSVLDALLGAVEDGGAEVRHPFRVETIAKHEGGFRLAGPQGQVDAARVVLATGGQSVVQTGSDGHGYVLARALGHALTPDLLPALVPLCLPDAHLLTTLRGVAADVTLEVVSPAGRGPAFTGSLLLTHFGISGPVAMDISRFFLAARKHAPETTLRITWLPGETEASMREWLRDLAGTTPAQRLAERLPRRLADALCALAGVDPDQPGDHVSKRDRLALVSTLVKCPLPVTGARGWPYAEVTAGGIPLSEIDVNTMASRVCPGLYLCGEICDVDGRIGGFNFQWAWSSGHVAGAAAAASLPHEES